MKKRILEKKDSKTSSFKKYKADNNHDNIKNNNELWKAVKKAKNLEELYKVLPFSKKSTYQTKENVIQYLLMVFSKEENFEKAIFNQIYQWFEASYKDIKQPRYIATIISNVGKLTQYLNKPVAGDAIRALLHSLLESSNQSTIVNNARDISSTVYGLGLLAKGHRLPSKTITSGFLQKLVQQLLKSNFIIAQDISNTVYGLGLLASQDQLSGELDSKLLNSLVQRLLKSKPIAQNISNTVYGLGLLASQDKLSGELNSNLLNSWIQQLLESNFIAQDISSTVYGLGLLASQDKLSGELDSNLLNSWVQQLLKDPNEKSIEQAISNTLYGLSLLASQGQFARKLDSRLLSYWVQQLLKNPNEEGIGQAISNTVYGLGLLASQDKLSGELNSDLLNSLVQQLLILKNPNKKSIEQVISNTVYGLGLLASQGQFAKKLDSNLLNSLVQQLLKTNPTAQNISNTMYGLGLLASQDKLSRELNSDLLNSLAQQLLKNNFIAQDISHTVYSLGLLASQNKLSRGLNSNLLNDLVQQLLVLKSSATAQNIANTVYGLGLLASQDKLLGDLDSNLLDVLLQHLQKSNDESIEQAIANTVYGLNFLIQTKQIELAKIIEILGEVLNLLNIDLLKIEEKNQLARFYLLLLANYSKETMPCSVQKFVSSFQCVQLCLPKPSKTCRSIFNKLCKNKFIEESEMYLEYEVLKHPVDMCIKVNNRLIILEIDGETHYDQGVLCIEDKMRDFNLIAAIKNKHIDEIDEIIIKRFSIKECGSKLFQKCNDCLNLLLSHDDKTNSLFFGVKQVKSDSNLPFVIINYLRSLNCKKAFEKNVENSIKARKIDSIYENCAPWWKEAAQIAEFFDIVIFVEEEGNETIISPNVSEQALFLTKKGNDFKITQFLPKNGYYYFFKKDEACLCK